MDDKAKSRTYSRPTRYPAALPRIMTTETQRAAVDEIAEAGGDGIAAVLRSVIADGLTLRAAYDLDPDLRADVERLAREAGGVEASGAIATMLGFAVRESRRRLERNARIAHDVGAGLGEMGFAVDGVGVSGIDISAR